jgi:hypothetical protein
MTALRYMQEAEGLGTAAVPVVADDPDARRAAVAAALAEGVPTYFTRELEDVADQYSFTGVGPLVRVWPRGQSAAVALAHRLDLPMLDGTLLLEGYDLARLDWAGGPVARLTLHWLPLTQLTQDLKVSLRIVAPDDTPRPGVDGEPAANDSYPLRQVAPTTSWMPGTAVADVYEVPLSPVRSPADRLVVIVYDAATLAEVGRFNVPVAP